MSKRPEQLSKWRLFNLFKGLTQEKKDTQANCKSKKKKNNWCIQVFTSMFYPSLVSFPRKWISNPNHLTHPTKLLFSPFHYLWSIFLSHCSLFFSSYLFLFSLSFFMYLALFFLSCFLSFFFFFLTFNHFSSLYSLFALIPLVYFLLFSHLKSLPQSQ